MIYIMMQRNQQTMKKKDDDGNNVMEDEHTCVSKSDKYTNDEDYIK